MKATTRRLGSFSKDEPKLRDFRIFLTSVEGHSKETRTAKLISANVSKVLYFVNADELKWGNLLDIEALLIKSMGVQASGRCTIMERIGDGHRYIRFQIRSRQQWIQRGGLMQCLLPKKLSAWKTSLRKEKKKVDAQCLAKQSNDLPPLENLNTFLELSKIRAGREPTGEEIRFATAAVAIPALISSSKRSGVVENLTQVELGGSKTYVVSVFEHKTGEKGPAELDREMYERATKYNDLIRPGPPQFFVTPGSKPIDKISNLTRVITKMTGVAVPNATEARKMGGTAVARKSYSVQSRVARHMNHDLKTSRDYYQATVGDEDAANVFNTIRSLRHGDDPCPSFRDEEHSRGVAAQPKVR